jgi:hypothetical protein
VWETVVVKQEFSSCQTSTGQAVVKQVVKLLSTSSCQTEVVWEAVVVKQEFSNKQVVKQGVK